MTVADAVRLPAGYSFCESIHASGTSPWHVRKLTEVGRKLGGGIDTPSLCGIVTRGWDLSDKVAAAPRSKACRGCVAALAKEAPCETGS